MAKTKVSKKSKAKRAVTHRSKKDKDGDSSLPSMAIKKVLKSQMVAESGQKPRVSMGAIREADKKFRGLLTNIVVRIKGDLEAQKKSTITSKMIERAVLDICPCLIPSMTHSPRVVFRKATAVNAFRNVYGEKEVMKTSKEAKESMRRFASLFFANVAKKSNSIKGDMQTLKDKHVAALFSVLGI